MRKDDIIFEAMQIGANVARFWSKVDRRGENDCWTWLAGKDRDGYGSFSVSFGSAYYGVRAHRVAWIVANGRIHADGMNACHTCDNPPCVNPKHVWIGTTLSNVHDKIVKGRGVPGMRIGSAMVTEDVVREIRRRWPKESKHILAAEFGLHERHIRRIGQRIAWKHVP